VLPVPVNRYNRSFGQDMPYAVGTHAIEDNRVASTGDSLDAVARGDPFYQSAGSFNFRKLGHG
jgi:hypothetical protein